MGLSQRLAAVREGIAAACARAGRSPDSVELIAVSKRHPVESLRELLALGQRDLGENRVQELVAKAADLRDPAVRWHMVGSVQTNKVRDLLAVEGLHLLHSLDRPKLARALEDELARRGTTLDVLVQVNATGEPNKHGLAPTAVPSFVRRLLADHPHLRVRGLMAMGPLEGDPTPVFQKVRDLRATLARDLALDLPILSLGMTDDMDQAIAADSTMVRVGTGVFGPRPT